MELRILQWSGRFRSTGHSLKNKAGYTATPVACGWAGAIIEVTGPFGQKQSGSPPANLGAFSNGE